MKHKHFLIRLALVVLFFMVTNYSGASSETSVEIIPADRRIDWTGTGVPGGIPERTYICKTIDSSVYGNGTTDATAVIQTALNNCPSGSVVYLPKGVYLISDTIEVRNFDTLRGAGPDNTILKVSGRSLGAMVAMRLNVYSEIVYQHETHDIVEARKDSQIITLGSTTGINPGDILLLNQLNDGVNIDSVGTNGKCTFCGYENGNRALGQYVEVTAVAGNKVYLNKPLHWTYNTSLDPWAYQVDAGAMVRWAGLEDLTLTQNSSNVSYMVQMQGAQYSWIKNVEIINISNIGIYVIDSLQNEIIECYIHDRIPGTYPYGIVLTMYSSNNRVEDNILNTVSGGGIETHGGATGNVISYNYFSNILYSDPSWLPVNPAINHGAHPKMNLWEGNIADKVRGDFIWGSSSHNTIFRSQSRGWKDVTMTIGNIAIELSKKNYYMNVIGNILGTPGKSNRYEALPGQPYDQSKDYLIWALGINVGGTPLDTNVAPTLLRHGNFDYVTNSVIWDPSISNHDLPASYYLSEMPGWWCQETPWPAIGPDVIGLVNDIPAKRRFEGKSCLRKDALELHGFPLNQGVKLSWNVNGTFPIPTTWRIDYTGPSGDQPSPITNIPSSTRQFSLTGLTNYTFYLITLTTDPLWLSDSVTVMPTDHFFFLPVISK